MSFYPQIGSGAIAQFPFARTREWRAISNQLEGGEVITLPDLAGGQMSWKLNYEELRDSESQLLAGLFNSSQGRFRAFTFIDPMANLLGWSEDLSRTGWQAEEMSVSGGIADPLGSHRAWTVANSGAAPQQLSQTLAIPGDYVACFSAYVRTDVPCSVTLQRDGTQHTAAVGSGWQRLLVSGTGTEGAAQSTFAVSLPAGTAVQLWGLQVEAQPWPSTYKPTSTATGIYEETYFADDELTITSTGPGFSRATINLISRI